MAKPVRRVVTGHNAAGKSVIARDGDATTTMEMASIPGLVVFDLWETTTSPADNGGDEDGADRPVHLEPAATGTIFRIVEFPPDAAWQDTIDPETAFDSIGAGHAADQASDDPMMHKTPSVDYAIVLEGEVWAVMDEGETCMKAGDVLVQRGTNHSWRVRGDSPARVAFVLVGAAPV